MLVYTILLVSIFPWWLLLYFSWPLFSCLKLVGFKKPYADSWGKGKLMLYTYICRYYCLVTRIFCWENVKSLFSFRIKTQIVTAKKFQNHGFQKYRSLCVSTFPQSSLKAPSKPCYTNVWGGWAVQGWTLRISPLLAFLRWSLQKLRTEKPNLQRAACLAPELWVLKLPLPLAP